MPRPSRLEILQYALTGVLTDRGTATNESADDEDWKRWDQHIEWLEKERDRLTLLEEARR